MQSFLSNVVSQVLIEKSKPFQKTIFVVPSQRACVFLKQELIKQINTATFLPKIISIENYIQELSETRQIDTIQLLFEFYSVYLRNTPKELQDSFDIFSQWATIVLQDFNEVDRHLIDTKDLFAYLRDINRLENWSPTTELTKNYFSFFEKLDIYYTEFYKYLRSKNIGYQGLIYREAESNIQHYIENNQDKKIVLCGFNALNKAEENIFQELLQSGLASIYWDADESYLKGNAETGMFLRKYKKEWNYFDKNPFNWVQDYLKSDPRNIQFIGAPKNVSQIKFVGELLQKQKNHNNTALVLADESLLSLTLNSLPKNVEKINITMGFPLKDIPLSTFFKSIFDLYLNQEKFKIDSKNEFYYRDVLHFLNHAYLKKLLKSTSFSIGDAIGKSNRIFLSEANISDLFKKELTEDFKQFRFVFSEGNSSVEKVLSNCMQLCLNLKEVVSGLEKEYVYRFFTVFQQLQTLNNKYGHLTNLRTLYQFYLQLVSKETLSFQGEPLEGLQLMGMLETRVIDFETIILTSVNEGVLPSSKSDQSFIPFDVKHHFNLPTYQEKDAVFSYHFYRLLHRAKNIYFVYNTESDAFGTGEKSRFLTQLEISRDDIKQSISSPKINIQKAELKEIPKTDDLMSTLKELAKKGISPSALATYINNPIDFYYQKILKIRALEEVEETVAVNTMGTVIHDTLEELYQPYINKILDEDSIKKMRLLANDLVEKYFTKEYINGDISKGKNKLVFEVSKKLIDRFLSKELDAIKSGKQIKIISLEQKLSATIKIDAVDAPIKLHGIIDRVDQVDGVLRILDYKTGVVTSSQLRMTDFSKMSDDYKYTKALQVMLYAYIYLKNNKVNQPMEAGIISMRNLKEGFLKMNFATPKKEDYAINQNRIDEFLAELKRLLAEVFNPEFPFKENPNKAF